MAAILMAVLFTAAACGPAGREIRIGSILSLSGEGEYYGKHIRRGMELAVDDLNGTGGIGGRTVRILFRDSESRPDRGVAWAEELYGEQRVAAIIGGVLSSVTLAVAPIAEREKKILLSPSSSSPKITAAGAYVFRNYPSDRLEGAFMAEFAARRLGLARLVVVAVNNEYGKGLAEIFRNSYRTDGRQVILDRDLPERDADVPGLVTEIRDRKPDGIYLVGYYREVAAFLREYRRQGGGALVLGVAGFHSHEMLRLAGAAAEGVVFPYLSFDAGSEDARVQRFVQAYRQRHQSDPDEWAAHGYDAVMILAEGIARAGEAPDRIRKALLEMKDHVGVAGTTRFDANGDVVKLPRIFTVHGGEFLPYEDSLAGQGSAAGGH